MGVFYRELTAPENQSVVRAVAMFGVSVSIGFLPVATEKVRKRDG